MDQMLQMHGGVLPNCGPFSATDLAQHGYAADSQVSRKFTEVMGSGSKFCTTARIADMNGR